MLSHFITCHISLVYSLLPRPGVKIFSDTYHVTTEHSYSAIAEHSCNLDLLHQAVLQKFR